MNRDHEIHQRLRRLVAGDQSAAAWLYDTFASRLFRRLELRYGYPGGLDAEDLLHDAFVSFFQHDARVLRRFLELVPAAEQTVARLERHLWDQACGLAANRRRSKARATVVPLGRNEVAPSPSAETAVIDRDRLAQLGTCIEKQGTRIYLYFKLRFDDGLKPAEISRLTGWSNKATYKLKQSLTQAVRQCAEQLGLYAS
jgi:DNA-directed RNA polymerase specialized sigma24 family protein